MFPRYSWHQRQWRITTGRGHTSQIWPIETEFLSSTTFTRQWAVPYRSSRKRLDTKAPGVLATRLFWVQSNLVEMCNSKCFIIAVSSNQVATWCWWLSGKYVFFSVLEHCNLFVSDRAWPWRTGVVGLAGGLIQSFSYYFLRMFILNYVTRIIYWNSAATDVLATHNAVRCWASKVVLSSVYMWIYRGLFSYLASLIYGID